MIKRILLFIFIFILTGELMIRLDQHFLVLESNHVVKISTNIEVTPEYEMLTNNTFTCDDNDLRIMVVGDSYIHGGGIDFKDNFSQQLKKLFKDSLDNNSNIWVLDVSRPNSNTLDNNLTYFQFVDIFNPHIVIIGYNFNDVTGDLNKSNENYSLNGFLEVKTSGGKAQSFIKRTYNIIYQSVVIRFIMQRSHKVLKNHGYVIPKSNFDNTRKSYTQNKESWTKSRLLLKEIIDNEEKRKGFLLFYEFPDINLLEHPELFEKVDSIIADFFNKYPAAKYRNARSCFKGEKSEEYILSKYDGHPNEKAHAKMAKDVFKILEKQFIPHQILCK